MQRLDGKLLLAIGAERGSTADDHFQLRARLEKRRREARRLGQQLLEVVEDQQDLLVRQVLRHGVQRHTVRGQGQAQRLRNGRGDDRGIADGRQGHEVHAVGELLARLGRDLQAEPGLADSARSRQGQEPRALQQLSRLGDHLEPADEAGQLRREVVGCAVERAQRRKRRRHAVDDELVKALGLGQVAQAMSPQVAQR